MKVLCGIACGVLALAHAGEVEAQGKVAGKMNCPKPAQNHVMPVGDSPDHVMMLSTVKCTWSQGDLGGDKVKAVAAASTPKVNLFIRMRSLR